MKNIIASIALLLATGATQANPSAATALIEIDGSKCTGVKLGANIIATATHCLPETYSADGITVDGVSVKIEHREVDRSDHVIFIVRGYAFTSWTTPRQAPYGPVQGETLTAWGYPGHHTTQQFRAGYASGVDFLQSQDMGFQVYTIQIPVYKGDSGGGLFDSRGRLVCQITGSQMQVSQGILMQNTLCFSWTFTARQMDEVRKNAARALQL